jgi:hypothetical protein
MQISVVGVGVNSGRLILLCTPYCYLNTPKKLSEPLRILNFES